MRPEIRREETLPGIGLRLFMLDGSVWLHPFTGAAPIQERPAWAIGDKIKFKAATVWGDKPATRIIRGFSPGHNFPMVKYGGWDNFIVRPSEISEINGEPIQ